MGNGLINFLFLIVGSLLLIVVSHQMWSGINEQYTIEVANEYSSADTVAFKGVFIRDEEIIKQNYTGVLSYPVTDGGKVAKDSVVAYVYSSEADIETNRQLKELQHEIELLRSAQNPGTVQTAQPEFISSLISEEYQSIAALLSKGDVRELKSHRDNLFTLMCIYRITVKQENDYDERIAELSAREAQLRVRKKDYRSVVTSPDSGYFVSYTDGFEGTLNYDNALDITADTINTVVNNSLVSTRRSGEIGKLIKSYDWKIAGIIDNSASTFNMGDTVTLSFASVPDIVHATIERLDDLGDSGTLAVMRCDEITYNLVRLRSDRVDMTLNDFKGIKVPRAALRFNKKNEKGCYVLWGQRVLFKKIDEIYSCEDYLLSRLTSDENYVCVYDNIIISGVDTAAYYANLEDEPPDEPEKTEEEGAPPEEDKNDKKSKKKKDDKDTGENIEENDNESRDEDQSEDSGEENEDSSEESEEDDSSGNDDTEEDTDGRDDSGTQGEINFE